MRFKVQLIVCTNDGRTDTTHEVAVLEKDCQRLEQLGLTLAEAKQLLTQLQRQMVEQQATAYLAARTQCPAWARPFRSRNRRPAPYAPSLVR